MTYLQALICKGIVKGMVANGHSEDASERGFADIAEVLEGLPDYYEGCADEFSAALDQLEDAGYVEWRYNGNCADYATITDPGYCEWLRATGRDPETFDPKEL